MCPDSHLMKQRHRRATQATAAVMMATASAAWHSRRKEASSSAGLGGDLKPEPAVMQVMMVENELLTKKQILKRRWDIRDGVELLINHLIKYPWLLVRHDYQGDWSWGELIRVSSGHSHNKHWIRGQIISSWYQSRILSHSLLEEANKLVISHREFLEYWSN